MRIKRVNFPWLFETNQATITNLPRKNLAPNTSTYEQYIIPELCDYIWLIDRGPDDADLLVIRVDEMGNVLQPWVIFASNDWDHPGFARVLKDERKRLLSDVTTRFAFDRKGRHYLYQCLINDRKFLCEPPVQFCAFVPLDSAKYKDLLRREKLGNELFAIVESKLCIQKLLTDADNANKRWCSCKMNCRQRDNRNMILCDNVKCPIGWYHFACVGLCNSFQTRDLWLCRRCRRGPAYKLEYTDGTDELVDLELEEASDNRIQRVKTLGSVWSNHLWPSNDSILDLFDKISSHLNIVASERFNIPQDGNNKVRAPRGSWVLCKERPEQMIRAKSCRGRVVR